MVNKVSTTFVIGYRGERFQTLPEHSRAWSAGIRPTVWDLYARGYSYWSKYALKSGKLVRTSTPGRYQFWLDQYAEIEPLADIVPPNTDELNPLKFFKRLRNPDLISISIDFITPPYQRRDARGIRCLGPDHPAYEQGNLYTLAQYQSANELLHELAGYYPDFELTRRHLLPHSFTSPIERSILVTDINGNRVGLGNDPGHLLWDLLLK